MRSRAQGALQSWLWGSPRERWAAPLWQREHWGWLTELTAQKAAAPRGADVLITGGFNKGLSHAPILFR